MNVHAHVYTDVFIYIYACTCACIHMYSFCFCVSVKDNKCHSMSLFYSCQSFSLCYLLIIATYSDR